MGYLSSPLAVRVRTKIKREVLRAPVVNGWANGRYLARIEQHAHNLPALNGERLGVLSELREQGVAVRNGTTMIPAGVLEVADRFVERLRESTQQPQERTNGIYMPEIELPRSAPNIPADCAPLYEWGLTDENLDLAECYLGLPVFFVGAAVRRERADGPAHYPTRLWHKDIDDRRMLKLIIYLNDVGSGGGAFEYLNRTASATATRAFRYSAGHLSDAAMAGVVERSDWISVTGPRLTTIFVDPAHLLHRAQPPIETDRYSLTLTYLSTTPLYQTFPESRVTPSALAGLSGAVTPRQRRAATAARLG